MNDVEMEKVMANLERAKELRAEQVSESESEAGGAVEADDEDDVCLECGSSAIVRSLEEGGGANRTKNRLVGGQRMNVVRKCADCGAVL